MSDHTPPTRSANPVDAARVAARREAPARCPRCGSRMGALTTDAADPIALYCGCCGLVVSDAR